MGLAQTLVQPLFFGVLKSLMCDMAMQNKRVPELLDLPLHELEAHAVLCHERGHIKQAIGYYRQLLNASHSRDSNFNHGNYSDSDYDSDIKPALSIDQRVKQWQAALMDCYWVQASEFDAQQLYKDAFSALESYQSLLGRSTGWLAEPKNRVQCYIRCALLSGHFLSIAQLIACAESVRDKTNLGMIRSLVAAYSLLKFDFKQGDRVFELGDSQFYPQYLIAKQALAAYCAHDNAKAQNCLKSLPFRSPFRDFGQIIKALLLRQRDPDAALKVLQRIALDSASGFRSFAHSFLPLFDNEHHGLDKLNSPSNQLLALQSYQNWPTNIVELSNELKALGINDELLQKATAVQTFNSLLVLNALPIQLRRQASYYLLVFAPECLALYAEHYGALSAYQHWHLAALHAEYNNDPEYALTCWIRADEVLRTSSKSHPSDHQSHTLEHVTPRVHACLLRRIACFLRERATEAENRCADVELELDVLQRSLELDDAHKDTYLRLMQIMSSRDTRAYYQWADVAIQKFPKDRYVLAAVMEAACAKKAYKKAAKYALELLTIDPINPKARQNLITCHLGHARKQAALGKYHIVDRELEQTEVLEPAQSQYIQIKALQAISLYQTGEIKAAKQCFKQAHTYCANTVLMRFILLVESSQLKLPAKTIASKLVSRLNLSKNLSSEDVLLSLMKQLKTYHDEGVIGLDAVLMLMLVSIKRLVSDELSVESYWTICERLKDVMAWPLLMWFSTQGKERFPSQQIFYLYDILAHAQGSAEKLSPDQLASLNELIQRSREYGDEKTAAIGSEFLKGIEEFYSTMPLFEEYVQKVSQQHEQEQDVLTQEEDDPPLFGPDSVDDIREEEPTLTFEHASLQLEDINLAELKPESFQELLNNLAPEQLRDLVDMMPEDLRRSLLGGS